MQYTIPDLTLDFNKKYSFESLTNLIFYFMNIFGTKIRQNRASEKLQRKLCFVEDACRQVVAIKGFSESVLLN